MKRTKILLAVGIMLTALTASAKKTSVDIANSPSSGLNALDYVLQKPLGNPSFPDSVKSPGKHLFLSINAGGSLIGNTLTDDIKPGASGGLRFGGWITPVHGFRVGIDGGIHSIYKGTETAWFGSVRADYLLNLTSLVNGYDPSRRFELIGAAGLKFQRVRQDGEWGSNYGGSASLQMRFNVAPSLYLYAEPEVSMVGGYHYDQLKPWYRMTTDFTLNLGFGYRLLSGYARRTGAVRFNQTDDDNLYFGGGVGIFGYANNSTNFKNPIARAFAGKMLSSTSGLQLGLEFGQYRREGVRNRHLTIASLDYVLDLNNACGGYRPSDLFQAKVNAGVSAGVVTSAGYHHKMAPGLQLGLMGLLRLSPNWGIYIHPQAYLFADRFNRALQRNKRPVGTVDIGLRYTIGDYSRIFRDTYHRYDSTNHWFINGGIGGSMFLRGDKPKGGNIFLGVGKRFTPVSSWRLNWEGNTSEDYTASTLRLDYLSSISTAMAGYNPYRVFDLQLVTGVFAGAAKYRSYATYGLTAGLQASFRLNSAIDLYVEPQILATYGKQLFGEKRWNPEGRLQIGLRYNLGTPAGVSGGTIADTPYGDSRNFIGISGGVDALNCKIDRRSDSFTGCFDVAFGHWFTKVSGARVVMSNDFVNDEGQTEYIGSGHFDYMLNLSSLIDRDPGRRFHIIGIAGAGWSGSTVDYSKSGPMVYGGAQLRYNLPDNIDLHLEPAFESRGNRVLPFCSSKFVMAARMTLGASYRF